MVGPFLHLNSVGIIFGLLVLISGLFAGCGSSDSDSARPPPYDFVKPSYLPSYTFSSTENLTKVGVLLGTIRRNW